MSVSQDGYRLLAALAIQNDYLDSADRATLKEVVYSLDLQGNPTLGDINQKWIWQQRIEAGIIYLVAKYEGRLFQQERAVPELEAAAYLDLPDSREDGKKYTVEDKKQLLKVDPDVAVAVMKLNGLKELVGLFNKILRSVFGRNQKLDHLGVNYRRELQADENS